MARRQQRYDTVRIPSPRGTGGGRGRFGGGAGWHHSQHVVLLVYPRRSPARRAAAWAARRLARWCWTQRRPLAPLYAALVLQVAGAVLAAAQGGVRTAVVLALLAAGWLAWRLHGHTVVPATGGTGKAFRWLRAGGWSRRPAPSRATLLQSWGTLTAATGWLVAAAAVGVGPPMPGLLGVAAIGCGVPWWWRHRIRPDTTVPVGDRVAVWAERVAGADRALPDSSLTQVADMPGRGWRAVVELPAGKLTTSAAIGATERIASAYGLPLSAVVVEPTPDGNAARASLMVLTTNPLRQVTTWPGPQLLDTATGTAPIGLYPDAEQSRYRFWRPASGAVHTLIAGTTEAGKSRVVDMLLAYERHSGLIVSWLCDPQRGQSLPDWVEHVDRFAGTAEHGLQLLRDARDVMYARNEHLAKVQWVDDKGRTRRGKAFFDPTSQMPLLSVTVEEAHVVLAAYPEAVVICEDIVKMGRKCGVELRLITQVPLLTQLGGSMTLRDGVAGGNVIVLRTANRLSGQVAFNGTLPVDPAQLPRQFPDGSTTSGLGYVLGASDRPATSRSYYVDDPYHWATTGTPATLEAGPRRRDQKPADRDRDEPFDSTWQPERPDKPAPDQTTGTARQRILDYLQQRGTEATTGVIAGDLGIPLPTVSKTLGRLAHAGLVRPVRRGMWTAARADDGHTEATA